MGCDSYGTSAFIDGHWEDVTIAPPYDTEGWPCQCTGPSEKYSDAEDVKVWAALGVAMVMAHHGEIGHRGYINTASDLPAWVLEKIARYVRP